MVYDNMETSKTLGKTLLINNTEENLLSTFCMRNKRRKVPVKVKMISTTNELVGEKPFFRNNQITGNAKR